MSHARREVHWFELVIRELREIEDFPTKVLQDNAEAISWTGSMISLRKVKYVGTRYHFVRDSVESGTVIVVFTTSSEKLSESRKNVLITADFIKHREWLCVTNYM